MIAGYNHIAMEQEQMVPKQEWMGGVTMYNHGAFHPVPNRFVDPHASRKAFFLSAHKEKVHQTTPSPHNKAYCNILTHKDKAHNNMIHDRLYSI